MNWNAVISIAYFVACMVVAIGVVWIALKSYWQIKPLKPSSPTEVHELREQVLTTLRAKGRLRDIEDEDYVAAQATVENLRFYARYADQYSVFSLNMIVSGLRFARSKGVTKLKSANFTDEHMAIYQKFSDFTKSRDEGVPVSVMSIIEPTMYAVSHPDKAPMILSLVCDRHIYDFKTIKTMLKEFKDNETHGAAALDEGLL